jgi:hypothetical protein
VSYLLTDPDPLTIAGLPPIPNGGIGNTFEALDRPRISKVC